MKHFKAWVGPAILAAGLAGGARAPAADIFEQNRQLGRGVNIIGYDPIWRNRDQARIQDKHFTRLKQAGFGHVRINLHPFRHMDREKAWALSSNWWSTLDWAVGQATNAGLGVVLDCHEFNAMADDLGKNREKFLAFWRQLSAHCANAPEPVVFELLNEPHGQLTAATWNELLAEGLATVRVANPQRAVIVGPPGWNAIAELPRLRLPEQDRRLIVTVHSYEPMEFTHQGASWSSHKDTSGVTWTGTAEQRAAVRERFARAAAWGKEHDRPLYLGEFGAYDKAPMASRAIYTDAIARTAESFGWSWAYWQFDSDFILWDMARDGWVKPILDALIPPPT